MKKKGQIVINISDHPRLPVATARKKLIINKEIKNHLTVRDNDKNVQSRYSLKCNVEKKFQVIFGFF